MRKRCIVTFWTVSPHSLGSCHFRVICLLNEGALPKDTTSELASLFLTISHKCRAPRREAMDTIFKVFWYDSARGMNPRSTDCEADALTTTPSRPLLNHSMFSTNKFSKTLILELFFIFVHLNNRTLLPIQV